MVYLQFEVPSFFPMRNMAPSFKVTPTSVVRVHANFVISPSFKVNKLVLMLRSHRFFSIWSRTHHGWFKL